MQRAAEFLDTAVPLATGSHTTVTALELETGEDTPTLTARLADGTATALADPDQLVGYRMQDGRLASLLLRNNGLHLEICLDREDPVGREHPAGIRDVVLGVPAHLGAGGLVEVAALRLSAEEQAALTAAAEAIRERLSDA